MDDLIGEFITETSESLSVLDQELVKLEQDPNNSTILGNIFRLVHTIKGTCGFLGLPRLESVAHAGENVLGKIRDGVIVVTPPAISLVLQALDCIKALVDHLNQHSAEPAGDDSELISRLNRFADSNGADVAAAVAGDTSAPTPPPPAPMEEVEFEDKSIVAASPEPDMAEAAPAPVAAAKPATAAAPAPAADAKPAEGGGGVGQSIRVSIDVLENLMQMVSELVLTRNQLLQIARTRNDSVFLGPLQQLSHITSELQEGIMKTRMQPIGNAWSKFPRLIRDLSLELGKKIDLRMVGADTELDRQLLEMIKDPLTHMVRNSCDHGLEMPADRVASGKPEMGTVTLSAFHEGGHIIIEIIDDGRGINIARVKEKAIANGLASAAEIEQMPDQQIMQFIFRAGFSTAEKVTSVSGRGVGMDVVRTNIEKIGGTIELSSELGKGSKFHIKIPLTLAIVSVLIVEANGGRFGIPQINVVELVRAAKGSEYQVETINHSQVLRLREKLLPLVSLSQVFGCAYDPTGRREEFIAVCKVGAYDFGLIVDRIYDTEEIVVKPVSSLLQNISVYAGNTILGDGSVIMILDPNGLARSTGQQELTKGQDDGQMTASSGEAMTQYLLFHTGEGAPKVVPLELVSRLEEIDMATVEHSGDVPVIQYRGDLMRLSTLDNAPFAAEGIREAIVFTYDGKTVGLVVDEIIDIVDAPLGMKLSSAKTGLLGSLVIAGKTTDVVDVAYILRDIVNVNASGTTVSNDPRASKMTILLAEDSPFYRNLTAPFLASAGFTVVTAEDGAQALVQARNRHFDLIVTDIEMPHMNGIEFTRAVRELAQYKDTPIVAYTATVNDQLRKDGRAAGMSDIVNKNDRAALMRAISYYLLDQREAA